MKLPALLPRDWRALIALAASIAGAAVLTGYSLWVVNLIAALPVNGQTAPLIIAALANSNYGLLAIIGAVLLSLGLAINRRTLKANFGRSGFEASGGDDPAPAAAAASAAVAVAGAVAGASAAVEKAEEIKEASQ